MAFGKPSSLTPAAPPSIGIGGGHRRAFATSCALPMPAGRLFSRATATVRNLRVTYSSDAGWSAGVHHAACPYRRGDSVAKTCSEQPSAVYGKEPGSPSIRWMCAARNGFATPPRARTCDTSGSAARAKLKRSFSSQVSAKPSSARCRRSHGSSPLRCCPRQEPRISRSQFWSIATDRRARPVLETTARSPRRHRPHCHPPRPVC